MKTILNNILIFVFLNFCLFNCWSQSSDLINFEKVLSVQISEGELLYAGLSNSNDVIEKGNKNEQAELNVPLWKSNIAYLIYGLLAMIAVFWLFKFQVKRSLLETQLAYEHKEAERLLELDKMKNNFFSNVTHEFRTPLTLIIEPLRQVLKEDLDDKIHYKLQLVKNNSEKLMFLVNQLLDIAKLESDNKMSLDLRKDDILNTFNPIYNSFLALARKKNTELKYTVNENLDPFYYDQQKLEKVFYNLISNAIKFTSDGLVKIEFKIIAGTELNMLSKAEKYLLIEVSDTGIGIPEVHVEHIFDRFFQVDGTKKVKSTGIGLALTKELVELMSGQIQVESKEGVGTKFKVEIPMIQFPDSNKAVESKTDGSPKRAVNRNESQQIASPKITEFSSEQITEHSNDNDSNRQEEIEGLESSEKELVLLIEDNDELRHFIKDSLSEKFRVEEASNGREGIEMAKKLIPDLVVSDLMMPEIDGYGVVEDLKNDLRTSHIPIILLTARSAMESKLEGLQKGVDDYITKPFHTEELLLRMANLIKLRKKLQDRLSNQFVSDEIDGTAQGNEKEKVEIEAVLHSTLDREFLENVQQFLEKNIEESKLSVQSLADEIFLSRSQLFRKLKALTGQTPNEYIRSYKLGIAMTMLKEGGKSIGQIAFNVGYEDPKYFTKIFKKRYGVLPKEV